MNMIATIMMEHGSCVLCACTVHCSVHEVLTWEVISQLRLYIVMLNMNCGSEFVFLLKQPSECQILHN